MMHLKRKNVILIQSIILSMTSHSVKCSIYVQIDRFCEAANLTEVADGAQLTMAGHCSLIMCEAKCLALGCNYIDYVGGTCYISGNSSLISAKKSGTQDFRFRRLTRLPENLSFGKAINCTPAGYNPMSVGPPVQFNESFAIDGNSSTMYQSWPATNPYFSLDLSQSYRVTNISIFTSYNSLFTMYDTQIYVTPTFNVSDDYTKYPLFTVTTRTAPNTLTNFTNANGGLCGRYVVFYKIGTEALSFMDIYVYAQYI